MTSEPSKPGIAGLQAPRSPPEWALQAGSCFGAWRGGRGLVLCPWKEASRRPRAGSHVNLPPWGGGGLPEVRHIMRPGPRLSPVWAPATKAQSGCTIRGRWPGGGG